MSNFASYFFIFLLWQNCFCLVAKSILKKFFFFYFHLQKYCAFSAAIFERIFALSGKFCGLRSRPARG
jgi:hypothetical protein